MDPLRSPTTSAAQQESTGQDGQQHDGTSDASPPAQKRQRAKQACEPCRLRKRRCDGNLPCNMCTQFEYKCYFEKHPRKRSKLVEQNELLHEGLANSHHAAGAGAGAGDAAHAENGSDTPRGDRPSLEDVSKMRSMEANSGQAFTRLLGLRLDPSSGPKLFTFAWNLGVSTYQVPQLPSITDYLTQDQMYILAKLYFTDVHKLYGFLDQQAIMEQVGYRWARPELCTIPDHLLAGIAAIGMLWSDGSLNAVLPQVVDLAKRSLDATSTMQPPCLTDVQSWILRTLYLRTTEHPHAVWMATCTVMHLVESIGIYQETNNSTLHPHAKEHTYDPEIRRRTFWVARMLNTWVSFEYGRTRVCLQGITCKLPKAQENDYTMDFLNLYSLSCCLDPDRADQAGQWEDFLRQLEEYEVRHDGIMLSKANLALCGYRRIRLANPTMSAEITTSIIGIVLKGLEAARRLAEERTPLWHIGNVTFQSLCVFLAMDSRESLAHVGTAMRTLEMIVERFDTVAMREALKTARFLVRLSKKRKDEDSVVLAHSLRKDGPEVELKTENLKGDVSQHPHQRPKHHQQQFAAAARLQQQAFQQQQQQQQQQLQQHQQQQQQHRGGMTTSPLHMNGGNASFMGTIAPMSHGTPLTSSSGEDWSMDILNNSDFDWNYFLTADMPAFQSFAPEGIP